jgi:hypothetical protein
VTSLGYYSGDQLGAAVAFNSVLSIPYALKGISAQLGTASASARPGPERVVALDFPSADAVIALGDRTPKLIPLAPSSPRRSRASAARTIASRSASA